MKITTDVETYWAAEVGEQVDILPDGWLNCPTDYSLYISGQYMVTLGSMADVEAWLERYVMLKEEA